MKFHTLLRENKFTLVVSLPENRIELVEAALRGGAQAVKVHVNVWHRASGHIFGTFAENRSFLKEMVRVCAGVPAGLVPGADEAFVTIEERDEIQALGIDFISSYAAHLPGYMLDAPKLSRMAAIDSAYTQNTLDGVNVYPPDVLELSIQPGTEYHKKLSYGDILRYADISSKVKIPTLVPTQKWMVPEDVRHLYAAGCKAVMIGAVVMGKEPGAADVEKATAAFARAIGTL
ncbi:MAG: hypothetical protein LBB78_09025 [Spirochaetaceae bacterium]|jgi:hypothetical protein|nr:hypothetical protein [Spirochaetaceae bacterium]